MALLCGTNCEDDGATLLDNLQSLLRQPDTSLPNPSTNRSKETLDVPESFHVAQQVQKDIGVAVHFCSISIIPMQILYSYRSVNSLNFFS
jgi:hypothetical protein